MIDLHNHTKLCGHAFGEIDDYVENAIEKGIKILGFSDHSPLPDNKRKGIAMSSVQLPLYVKEVLRVKKKYQKDIQILLGLEVDFPLQLLSIEEINTISFDYLIGSVHYIDDWGFDNEEHITEYNKWQREQLFNRYYEIILQLIQSQYFNIVGHIDLVKKFNIFDKFYPTIIEKILTALKNNNIIVEVNTAGLYKPVKEIYPDKWWLERLYKNNISITIGSDAHKPEEVGRSFEKAIEIIKSIGYRKLAYFLQREIYYINI